MSYHHDLLLPISGYVLSKSDRAWVCEVYRQNFHDCREPTSEGICTMCMAMSWVLIFLFDTIVRPSCGCLQLAFRPFKFPLPPSPCTRRAGNDHSSRRPHAHMSSGQRYVYAILIDYFESHVISQFHVFDHPEILRLIARLDEYHGQPGEDRFPRRDIRR